MNPSSSQVIEDALAEVAKARAVRERNMARRAEMQRKAEVIINRPSIYVLKHFGGQQLAFDLAGKHQPTRGKHGDGSLNKPH